jgi:hypothetical protein
VKYILSLAGILSTSAFAANHHCVYEAGDNAFTLDIYNKDAKPVFIVLMDEAKRSATFSGTELTARGAELVAVKPGADLSVTYLPQEDPNATSFQVRVTGEVSCVGLLNLPNLPVRIPRTFNCTYF